MLIALAVVNLLALVFTFRLEDDGYSYQDEDDEESVENDNNSRPTC